MGRHVIKYRYENGVKLNVPEVWCGEEISNKDWVFNDAQHAALSVGGSIEICNNCSLAIIGALESEL